MTSGQIQMTNLMIHNERMAIMHANIGTKHGIQALADIQSILATNNVPRLQHKLRTDPFFLSYVFGYSLLGGCPPPLDQELKLQLAPLMMQTYGRSYQIQHFSVFDAPLRARTLLDPEHYSIVDGIWFGLQCDHPKAPYLAFQIAQQLPEYANYNYHGRHHPKRQHLVYAVKSGQVKPHSLKDLECFTIAEYLMSSVASQEGLCAVAVASPDTNENYIDVNGMSLLVLDQDTGSRKVMQAGDFLSIVASRRGNHKDASFWQHTLGCFNRKEQVIMLEGKELSMSDVMPHVVGLGTKSSGREDFLLDKAVQALHDEALSLEERATQAMHFFQQAITTLDGITKSIEHHHRGQLWAVAMRTLAAAENGTTFASARGDVDFLQAFLVFLSHVERNDYFFWSGDYEVNGKRYTASQDANAVRCLALSQMTNWVDGVDVEIKCLGDSFIFDTTRSFKYLIRYPEGRSLVWNKNFVNQWVFYGCSAMGLRILPIVICKRTYAEDGRADAERVLVTRDQYFPLLNEHLDPGNETVLLAMKVLEANPNCSRLINVSEELKATVKAETKISNYVGEVQSNQSRNGELAKLSPEDAAALKETLIDIEGIEKTIILDGVSEEDAAALQQGVKQTLDSAKVSAKAMGVHLTVAHKLAMRGLVGEVLDDFKSKSGKEVINVRMSDLPPITPVDLDKYSSITIQEHPDVEAFLNNDENITTFGVGKAVAALCCVIL